jgi:hypothetical protein
MVHFQKGVDAPMTEIGSPAELTAEFTARTDSQATDSHSSYGSGDINLKQTFEEIFTRQKAQRKVEDDALMDWIRTRCRNVMGDCSQLRGIVSGVIHEVSDNRITMRVPSNWADNDPRYIAAVFEGAVLLKAAVIASGGPGSSFHTWADDEMCALMKKKTHNLLGLTDITGEPEGNLDETNPELAHQMEKAWKDLESGPASPCDGLLTSQHSKTLNRYSLPQR